MRILAHHALAHIRTSLSNYSGNYLEIGVFEGFSIKELATLYPEKQILAVDPFIEDGNTSWLTGINEKNQLTRQKNITLNSIEGISNIKFFEMTSIEFANILTQEKIQKYDISVVFIDGSHHYEDVSSDWKLALRLLNDKPGEIIFDDVDQPDVKLAVEEFVEFTGGKILKSEIIDPNCLVFVMN